MNAVTRGQVIKLTTDKGYGFLRGDDGKEYFFHRSACQSFETMREGQAVTFEPGTGTKGPRAERVELA
jgi:CspA family cold shock protein